MVKNIFQSRWVLGFLLLCAAQTQAGIFNEQPKNLIEERSYAAVFGTLTDINRSGNFDGSMYITPASSVSGPQEMNLVPRIKRSFGGGALVGYRLNEYAVEISYWRSTHIAEWGDTPVYQSTAIYQAVNVDLKRYFLPRLPAQPFLQAGLSFPWLDVKDASFSYANGSAAPGVSPSDATYSGLGFNLEVGLEIYLNSQFSVFGGVQQRWAGFNKVKGYFRETEDVQNGDNPSFSLKGDGVNFLAGVSASFF
jgi:hypothetical protein